MEAEAEAARAGGAACIIFRQLCFKDGCAAPELFKILASTKLKARQEIFFKKKHYRKEEPRASITPIDRVDKEIQHGTKIERSTTERKNPDQLSHQ